MTSYITPEERRFGYIRYHPELVGRGRHLIFPDEEEAAVLADSLARMAGLTISTPPRRTASPAEPPRLTRTRAIRAEHPVDVFIRQPELPSPTPSLAETLAVDGESEESRSTASTELLAVSLISSAHEDEHLHRCFTRAGIRRPSDIRVGDTGTAQIGYGVISDQSHLRGQTEKEVARRIHAAGPIVPHTRKPITKAQSRIFAKFLSLSWSPNGTQFVGKLGKRGLFLAEKISDYYYDPLFELDSRSRYGHRFGFRVIRRLTAEEAKIEHGVSAVVTHKIVV